MTKFVIKKENGEITASVEHQITKQEAIDDLKNLKSSYVDNSWNQHHHEAFDMAIQALETLESLRSYFKAHPYDLHWHGFKGEKAFDKIIEEISK